MIPLLVYLALPFIAFWLFLIALGHLGLVLLIGAGVLAYAIWRRRAGA